MKVLVPQCPNCKKKHTLVLTEITAVARELEPLRVRCIQSAGGCGVYFYLDDLGRIYVEEERAS